MRHRLASVWRAVLSLSWPLMVERTTRTLMRTVDALVTALFSPIAVAAIGLADRYAPPDVRLDGSRRRRRELPPGVVGRASSVDALRAWEPPG